MEDLRYPIGRFDRNGERTQAHRDQSVDWIEATPELVASAVAGLSEEQLDEAYRPGGWSIRQVVHHLPDSHMNSYIRLKLALTEDEPTIRAYDEAAWAALPDSTGPIRLSIDLLTALHGRWTALFRSLSEEQWSRRLRHPESGLMSVEDLAAYYDWHGRHHVAHIASLRERRGW